MNIIILSATTGGGHMRAANAIKGYVESKESNAKVKVIDTIEYINPIINFTITKGYVCLAKKLPNLYGKIYEKTDTNKRSLDFVTKINKVFAKKLIPIISEFKVDVIITTHPFSTTMASLLREEELINCPIICVMTDYAPHSTWINSEVDAYIVSNDDMKKDMVKLGVDKDKIYPFGIPVDTMFFTYKDMDKLKREMKLERKKTTILIMAGSFGVNNIFSIYKNIISIEKEFEVVIITGKNKKLYNKLRNIVSASPKNTKLIYFTDKVYAYMATCDLLITKPGGLTITEAISASIPMAVFDAIPGQEEKNADFLIKNNMAVRIDCCNKCNKIIEELICDEKKLKSMKEACKSYRKSNCNKDTLTLIKQIVGEKKSKYIIN